MSTGPLFPKYRAGDGEGGDALARAATPGLSFQTAEVGGTTTRTSGQFIDVESEGRKGLFYTAFRDYEPRYTPFEIYPTPQRSSFNEERAVRESRVASAANRGWHAGRPLPPASQLTSAGFRAGHGLTAFIAPGAVNGDTTNLRVQFSRSLRTASEFALSIRIDNTGKFDLDGGDRWGTWDGGFRLFGDAWARPVFSHPFTVALAGASSADGKLPHFGIGIRTTSEKPAYLRFENGKRVADGKVLLHEGQGTEGGGTHFCVTRVGPQTLIGVCGQYADQRYLFGVSDKWTNFTDWDGSFGLSTGVWKTAYRPAVQISTDNGASWAPVKSVMSETPTGLFFHGLYTRSQSGGSVGSAVRDAGESVSLFTYPISDLYSYASSASRWNEYVATTVYRTIVLPESKDSALVLRYIHGDQFYQSRFIGPGANPAAGLPDHETRNRLYEVWRVNFGGGCEKLTTVRRPARTEIDEWIGGGPNAPRAPMAVSIPGDDSPFSTHLPISRSPRIFADFATGKARYLITDGVANDQAADLRGAERRRQYVTSDFVSFKRINDEPALREFMGERRWLGDSIIVPIYAGPVVGPDGDKHEYHLLKSDDLGDTWTKLSVLYRGDVGEPPIASQDQAGTARYDLYGTSSDGLSLGNPFRVMRALTRFNTVEWVYDATGKPAALNSYSGAWVCDDRYPAPKLKD